MNFYVEVKGYRAYVLNGEGESHEPVHIHIKQGSKPNDQAKFWISFDQERVILEHNRGKIDSKIWQEIVDGVIQYEMNDLLRFWSQLKNVSILDLDFYDQNGYVDTKTYYPHL